MEKSIDNLTKIWDFMNSYWFPLCVAIIGIVTFGIMFFKANRHVDKHRKEVQQKIVDDAYAEYTKKENEKPSPSQNK